MRFEENGWLKPGVWAGALSGSEKKKKKKKKKGGKKGQGEGKKKRKTIGSPIQSNVTITIQRAL